MAHPYRTHTCGELRTAHVGQTVKLSGWVFRKRDHGGLLFYDLRDHYGLTQIVVDSDRPFFEASQQIKLESVITIVGTVKARMPETVNKGLATGDIEVFASELVVLNAAETLPLQLHNDNDPEDTRLKYRFVDLRRERLHQNIVQRSRVISSLRRRMIDEGFTEFQTPILTSSSPEGARDFLVPSRLHPGQFYALPQAPQQFKQLLMVAGFDRYFQIAPCFRDEDARADRSPGEFYQLDLEMSFVTQDDVFEVVQRVIHGTFEEFSKWKLSGLPFPRITYRDSMLKYGSDKPDLRIPLEIFDATDLFQASGFGAFKKVADSGGIVRCLGVKKVGDRPRSFFDKLVDWAKELNGGKGLAWLLWEEAGIKGPIQKFLKPEELAELAKRAGIGAGDALFLWADVKPLAEKIGGELRVKLGRELDLIEKDIFKFCWIVDFPMYEWDDENKKWEFSHNPFSMPQGGMEALETKSPGDILAYQYDIVCNGVELSSGAIRNHLPQVMYKAFELAGYGPEVVDAKFGGMINAFKLGAPPHGGIAPGVDRIVMLLANEPNLREVVAFPMNQQAQDLMMGAPSEVSEKQLKELHIRCVPPPPKDFRSEAKKA